MRVRAFSREKLFTSPRSGRFGGSPASLLIVSVLALYSAILCLLDYLHGQPARSSIPLAVIFLAVSLASLYFCRAAWKRHNRQMRKEAGQ